VCRQALRRACRPIRSLTAGPEYYLLGKGLILAAIHATTMPEAGTDCGLVLISLEHLNRETWGRTIEKVMQHDQFRSTVQVHEFRKRRGCR